MTGTGLAAGTARRVDNYVKDKERMRNLLLVRDPQDISLPLPCALMDGLSGYADFSSEIFSVIAVVHRIRLE